MTSRRIDKTLSVVALHAESRTTFIVRAKHFRSLMRTFQMLDPRIRPWIRVIVTLMNGAVYALTGVHGMRIDYHYNYDIASWTSFRADEDDEEAGEQLYERVYFKADEVICCSTLEMWPSHDQL